VFSALRTPVRDPWSTSGTGRRLRRWSGARGAARGGGRRYDSGRDLFLLNSCSTLGRPCLPAVSGTEPLRCS